MSERLELDERLRRAARTYRRLGNHTAEGMFLEAADTITELRGALQVASVDYRHLQDENAKLRELVSVSIEFCADGMCGIYDNCPLNAADGRCMFDERARELGVEVNG